MHLLKHGYNMKYFAFAETTFTLINVSTTLYCLKIYYQKLESK